MNKLKTLCILLILPMLMSACAAKKPTASPLYEFRSMSLSKSIDKTGDTAVAR